MGNFFINCIVDLKLNVIMTFLKYTLLLLSSIVAAQSKLKIEGHFNLKANTDIALKGFSYDGTSLLDKGKTDSNGNFSLLYPSDYIGAAIIEIGNDKKVIVMLNNEDFKMSWEDLATFSSLKFRNSPENTSFDAGLQLYQTTESKKSGISYLIPYYADEPGKQKFLLDEMKQLNNTMDSFLKDFSNQSYAGYYLKIRVLTASLPLYAKQYFQQLPEVENNFNQLDFTDKRLLRSGLYFELLDAFVLAMESYGEGQYDHLNKAIDGMLASLKSEPDLAQDITEYLYNLLEKRSLFKSSEHLALAMLSDTSCQLDDKHKALFEQYRKMANGNKAPDIQFANAKQSVKQLSDLNFKYKLIVFGASWCPKCNEEIPKMASFYQNWKKNHKLEIVFVSLDTQKAEYENFIKGFPWISSCDFMGWETKAALDYCVFATPTMYLLDADNKILLKPISPEQLETWLQYP